MSTNIYKAVKQIRFSVLGNEEIKNMSALGKMSVGVDVPELFDNLKPKRGGLIDPRMGTTDYNIICETCELNSTHCGGHFGHIVLGNYVFNIEFLPYVKKILGCICLKCSNLLLNKTDEAIKDLLKGKRGKDKLSIIKDLVSDVAYCQRLNVGCGTPVTKIRLEPNKSDLSINMIAEIEINNAKDADIELDGKLQRLLTPEDCYNILKNISDNDCRLLGIDPDSCRPENLIQKIFPVPPVAVRPSVRIEGSSLTCEDDLTRKLVEIVKRNKLLYQHAETMGGTSSNSSQFHLLQYHIGTYINNETQFLLKSLQKGGKPLKSIITRLKGKEGLIRNNLMGKRVDFSGRTVITPDPSIDVNQVGIPLMIAMNLTYPEVVTPHNIEYLRKLVRNGKNTYPGANFVIQKESNSDREIRIVLMIRRDKIELRYGDVVERHLVDGDIVLLNRQPTLHKQSMMGHHIHVINDMSFTSFRLNVGAAKPYNADYDGDEMNITVPQSIQTKTELEELSDVKHVVVSARTSKPIMGVIQDGLLGAYNMTKKTTMMNWKTSMNLLANLKLPKSCVIEKNKTYSGSDIYSCIIPEKINRTGDVNIKFGKIVSGQITNAMLGDGKPNNLMQLILDEYNVDMSKDFFDNTQKLINKFNLHYGFSVGMADIVIPSEIKRQVIDLKNKAVLNANMCVTETENNPDIYDLDVFESNLMSELGGVREDATSNIILKVLDDNNSINIMGLSGARGSALSTGQIIGFLGQPALEMKRMPKKIGKRGLPYFFRNDDTAYGRGFIGNGFLDGLEFTEFVFHNMSAREALIDTAIKTADTGYIQRKLIKSLEDVKLNYDGTLRTASGNILQFIYGDSGADTTRQYNYTIDFVLLGDAELEKKYKFTDSELKLFDDYNTNDNDHHYSTLLSMRHEIRKTQVKTKIDYKTFKTHATFIIPVNLVRILDKTKNMTFGNDKLTPKYIISAIDDLLSHDKTMLMCMSKSDRIKPHDEIIAKNVLKCALYDALFPKRCILEYKYTRGAFDFVMSEFIKGFERNMADPGEMVGIVAVQAIVPPLTQFTLNTFHQSGIGGIKKGKTTPAIPRLKELLSATKNVKTPQMIVYLDKNNRQNKENAKRISAFMKQTTLMHIRNKVDVYYIDDIDMFHEFSKRDNIGRPFYVNTKIGCKSDPDRLPWLARIEFDREKLLRKDVTLLDVQSKFCNMWEMRFRDPKKMSKDERNVIEKVIECSIMSNTDNDTIPVVYVRFDMVNYTMDVITNFIDTIIDNLKIKGLDNVIDSGDPSEEACIDMDTPDNSIKSGKEFIIYTSGINMYDIRYINGIDIARTLCNDIAQIYDIFGIEAARIALLREITNLLDIMGTFVNYHHLSVLVDLMTRDGFLISIDIHGINKTASSPLGRASFEKPIEQFITAAIFGEVDNLDGVSSRIMTGNIIRGGTGMCDILFDTDAVEKSQYIGAQHDKAIVLDSGIELINDVLGSEYTDIFAPI